MCAPHDCFHNITINSVAKKVRMADRIPPPFIPSVRPSLSLTRTLFPQSGPHSPAPCHLLLTWHPFLIPALRHPQVNQGPTMWSVLRGNCQDSEIPAVTIEFDFEWPEVSLEGRGRHRRGGGACLEGRGGHERGMPPHITRWSGLR